MSGVADYAVVAAVLTGLGLLWRIYAQVTKARDHLVAEVKRSLAADASESAAGRVPQPMLVSMQREFLTKEEHAAGCRMMAERADTESRQRESGDAKLEKDIWHLGNKLDVMREALQTEGSRRAKNINDRVDAIGRELGGVVSTQALTTQRLVQLDQKIDRLLERFSLSIKTTTP